MGIPKTVRDANDKANQMIKDRAKERQGTLEESAAPPTPDPQPAQPVETPPTPESPPPEAPAESVSPQPSEDDPNSETWKHRYEVLKGKFAEIGELNEQNKLLAGQVNYLNQQNQGLEQRLRDLETRTSTGKEKEEQPAATPSTPSQKALEDPEIKYFQKEYEDIYKSTVVLCGRMIQEALEGFEKKIDNRLAAEETKSVQTKKEKFYEALEKAYPDWEKIQRSLEFGEFMREMDPLSGFTRWQLLKHASDHFDAPRAIRFFDLFYGKTSTPAETNHPSADTVKNRIAPPKGGGNLPPGNGGGNENQMSSAKAREEYKKLCDLKVRHKISEAHFKKEEARLNRIMRGP